MKILLTNDDGVQSAGLGALAGGLSAEHTIYIVAPDRQRSTVSHSLTLHKPLRVKKRNDLFSHVALAYEVNGMPADCVKIALRELVPERPDLVISGINEGPNLGTDVVYSGTVSAAREAVLEGVPALAVSLTAKGHTIDYSGAARFIAEFIPLLQRFYHNDHMLLNINIPPVIQGVDADRYMITRLGDRKYESLLEKRQDPGGREYYWMMGDIVDEHLNEPDTDVRCVLEGKVSVTPLYWDFTNEQERHVLRNALSKSNVLRS